MENISILQPLSLANGVLRARGTRTISPVLRMNLLRFATVPKKTSTNYTVLCPLPLV